MAVGAAAGVAGYLLGSGDDEETAATTTVTEHALPAGWRLCTNERMGYAVGYPGDWYSPALSAESECTFFDPAPVALPEASDVFGPTLQVAPSHDTYDALARGDGAQGPGVELIERS